jgi:hypothetical protein
MLPLALIALIVSAAPDAGTPARPWDIGLPGQGVPGWPYVGSIPFRGKTYATVQAVIDAAPDQSTIELPHGVYGLPLSIVNRKGLRLVGKDGPAFLLSQSAIPCLYCRPNPVVFVSNSSDISFENIFITRDVRGDEGELLSASTIWVNGSSNVTFRHVWVGSKDGTSVMVTNTKGAVMEDCVVENETNAGVVVSVKKDGTGGMTIRSSLLHAKHSAFGATSGDPCDWIGKDVRFPALSVTGSLLWGQHWPSVCPQMAPGMKGNVIVREMDWPNLYKLGLEAQNVVVEKVDAAPMPATVPSWRPPPEILGKHLEEFGVLPPADDDVPAVGTQWPFCVNKMEWPLFPDGPQTLNPLAQPTSMAGCSNPEGAAYATVDQHRKGWIRLALGTGGGYSRQAPLKVWQRLDRLFTPCMLESNGDRAFTHVMAGKSVEAVDDSHVVIVGSRDVCGKERLIDKVLVPKALRPALRRPWKLVCTAQPTPELCAPRPERDPVPHPIDDLRLPPPPLP